MQAERERVRLENEKHFKRIINKFPHIENGRHKDIFKRRDDSDNQFMNWPEKKGLNKPTLSSCLIVALKLT